MSYLEQRDLLCAAQHGFRRGHSCLTSSLYSQEKWTRATDQGRPVDVIFFDFKKAFDSVPHGRLLQKIWECGIQGSIFNWIKSFLSCRLQKVIVGATTSEWVPVKSGVPQGSVLGPLLFLIYINDCPADLECDGIMFADDIKIWKTISCVEDAQKLQEDVNKLAAWSSKWILAFNVSKCVVLRLESGRRRFPKHQYVINGVPLNEVDTHKDLGVWTCSNLLPSQHCKRVVQKTTSTMHWIRRAFKIFPPELFSQIFGTFVRPLLEHGMPSWMPWMKKDSDAIEQVQRRATKLVDGLRTLSYPERLI
nr:unnamed protein product [Spirometra erinaceieuropaei]